MTPFAEYANKGSKFLLRAARAENAELTSLCMRVALAYQMLADAHEALAQWEKGRTDGKYVESWRQE